MHTLSVCIPPRKTQKCLVLFANWNWGQRSLLWCPGPRSTARTCYTLNLVPHGGRCAHVTDVCTDRHWAQIERSAQEDPWERLPAGHWAKRLEARETSRRKRHLGGESRMRACCWKMAWQVWGGGDRQRGSPWRLRGRTKPCPTRANMSRSRNTEPKGSNSSL